MGCLAMGATSSCKTVSKEEPLKKLGEVDEALTKACSCEILNTTKGLLKGKWGDFGADAFYRPFPQSEMLKVIRHVLIVALSIEKYAEREGEHLQTVELLGEGSYAKVFGLGPVAAKIISDSERPWVHKAAVSNSLLADREGFGPAIYGHGRVQQLLGGHFAGTVIFMERLQGLEAWSEGQIDIFFQQVAVMKKFGFHNDLKMPNILKRPDGRPVLIDFDLLSQWSVKVAVTSSCIEHDFQSQLEQAGESCTESFREYYDLFVFSLTIEDGFLYRRLLQRLSELWGQLEGPIFKPLLKLEQKLTEIPFEVLIRVPLRGVSVCFLDLRGNLFAHMEPTDHVPEECLKLPQLVRSNGVYWPQWVGSKLASQSTVVQRRKDLKETFSREKTYWADSIIGKPGRRLQVRGWILTNCLALETLECAMTIEDDRQSNNFRELIVSRDPLLDVIKINPYPSIS